MAELEQGLLALLSHPWVRTGLWLTLLLLAAWLANFITTRVLLRVLARLARITRFGWDDLLLDRGVPRRLAHVVPALVICLGIDAVPHLVDEAVRVARNVALAYIVLTLALAATRALGGVNLMYEARNPDRARARPVKGYLQVAQLLVYLIAGIIMVAVLIERSPLLLLSGLGALTAVLLLVFKDTILSLVASIQLGGNDMLRVGDWIEMPSMGADGDVIDIALNTVKVQNWDKTITTIPTYRMIEQSFRNWRGMSESGGRRIKRALLIDQTSVHFLEPDEEAALARFSLLREHLRSKRAELARWNQDLREAGQEPVNTRRLTNLGCLRAYVEAYLRHHPRIHPDMTRLVRQLEPGSTGLPLEIYCFTTTVAWAEYESIQADVFDHLLAILPEFGLTLFQAPGASDLRAAATALGATPPLRASAARR